MIVSIICWSVQDLSCLRLVCTFRTLQSYAPFGLFETILLLFGWGVFIICPPFPLSGSSSTSYNTLTLIGLSGVVLMPIDCVAVESSLDVHVCS